MANPTTGKPDHLPGNGRIALWSIPRSTSTVFQKCLSAIDGIEMWFEPFTFAHYANTEFEAKEKKPLPLTNEGNEAMYEKAAEYLGQIAMTKMNADRLSYATIQKSLENSASKYILFKDHAFSMDLSRYRQYLPMGFKHAFIIRHPILVYRSQRKAMYKQLLEAGRLDGEDADEQKFDLEEKDDVLFPQYFYTTISDLWKFVRSNIDPDPIVIDSDDLLTHPATILPKFSEAVGLPYDVSLLTWDASLDVLDTWKVPGDNALREIVNFLGHSTTSSKFETPGTFPLREQLTADVIRLSDAAMPYYNEMYEARLRP